MMNRQPLVPSTDCCRPSLVGLLTVWACVTFATWLSLHAADDPAPVDEPPAVPGVNSSAAASVSGSTDRSLYVGARACIDCHRSEYVSWLGTQHYHNTKKNRFDGGESSIDTKYKAKVGNLDLCYTCHSAASEERFGRAVVETGTSCESCHGAAGGEDGWLNRHAVYGPNVTPRQNETPEHYESRIAFCDQAGMIRPGRQYEVAKNCFRCHLITDPVLVSEAVGHPVSFTSFSLIPYLRGEVRHNFHVDQRHNADTPTLTTERQGLSLEQRNRRYLVLEQFAKMEVALQTLADSGADEIPETELTGKMENVIEDAAGELEDFLDELQDPEDESLESLTDEQVQALQGAIDEFERFDDLDEKTTGEAARSASAIADLAAQFAAEHDGSRLTALDVFMEDLPDPVGKALQP